MIRRRTVLTVLPLALLVGGGCTPPPAAPARYWTLGPIAPHPPGTVSYREAIGLGPVTVARYLDRSQLVRRSGSYRLELADRDSWPEPLAEHLGRVLADDLEALLPANEVRLLPADSPTPLAFRLQLEVLAFEATPTGKARLDARWTLIRERDGQWLISRRSRIDRPVTGADTEALVAALSETVSLLAREMAAAVTSAQR